jgi:uncharacterized protein
LIPSCGDLRPSFLDFLVSSFNVPCFYVRGNHDTTYQDSPPAGEEPVPLGGACRVDPERPNWDLSDLPHRGSGALRGLIARLQPQVFLHGHTHLGYGTRPRELRLGRTRVVDAFGHVVLDIEGPR